jgi:nucleoside-diphosphate kinase
MAKQRTLVLIKPDGVQRGLVGDIIGRIERKGMTVVGLRKQKADKALARKHYGAHQDKPFFGALIDFITSSPLVALAIEGEEAVSIVRNLMGPTDGRKAPPGSVRGDFSCSIGANIVHGSDSPEAAKAELALWFPKNAGIVAWQRSDAAWLDA